ILPCGLPHPVPAAEDALDLVARLEEQLTVYRDNSEMSRLNQRAASESVSLEPRLYALLGVALRLSEETDGAFDVTAGALIKTWGFYRRAGRVPSMAERRETLRRTGFRKLR